MDSQLDGLRDPHIRGANQARVKPYGSNIAHYQRECSLLGNPLDALVVWSMVFFTRHFCYYYYILQVSCTNRRTAKLALYGRLGLFVHFFDL